MTSATTAAPASADQKSPPLVRHDRAFVAAVAVLAVVLRFPSLLWPLMPDESGFVLVARHWHAAADNMYGAYWVDRPPILIGLFKAADWLGGAYAPRAVGAALAAAMVVAAYRAGLLLAGRAAARWVAVACLALMSQPDFTMWSAKSESLGVPFAMVSCLLIVETLYGGPGRRRLACAFGAGLVGALALGMKQNLFGPEVLGVVVFAQAVRTRRFVRGEARRVATATVAGFAVPVLAVVGWADAAGVRLSTVWEMVYGFRGQALDVITEGDMAAPLGRADELIKLFMTTGIIVVLAWFVLAFPATYRAHRELAPAVALMLVVDTVSLVLSGSYWGSYMLPLVPGVTLAIALLAAQGGLRLAIGRVVVAAVALSTAFSLVDWGMGHSVGSSGGPTAHYTGQAVADVAGAGDTILVLYGRADIVLASGLPDPYEQLWSLPTRTLDPDLVQVKGLLTSPRPPTWVVEWSPVDTWDLDRDGSLRSLLAERYNEVQSPCGIPVWLLEGVGRPAFPAIDCSDHWFAFG